MLFVIFLACFTVHALGGTFVGWGDRVDMCPPGHLIDRSAEMLILHRGGDNRQTIGEAARRYLAASSA